MSDRFDMATLSRLRLKQLALVASLSETRNLHASARELNLSQPGATKLLQEVERILGVSLFTRGSKGMEPTVFGVAAARQARTVLSEIDRLTVQMGAMSRGELGSVRMGSIMEAVPGVLTDVLNKLILSGTGPLINLTVSTSDHLVAGLTEGELDLALGRPVENIDMGTIRFEPLWAEELTIIAAAHHPLTRFESLALEQLLEYEWILQSRPSPMRTAIELTFARVSLPFPNSRLETSSMLMTTNLVSQSDLLAVLPRSVARFYVDTGLIAGLGVELDGFIGRYGLLVPNRNEPDPNVEALVRHIQSIARA